MIRFYYSNKHALAKWSLKNNVYDSFDLACSSPYFVYP